MLVTGKGNRQRIIPNWKQFKYLKKYLININNRIVSQHNKGLEGARNRGLNESKTKYTYFTDKKVTKGAFLDILV